MVLVTDIPSELLAYLPALLVCARVDVRPNGPRDGQFYIELIKSIYVWTYKEEFIAN